MEIKKNMKEPEKEWRTKRTNVKYFSDFLLKRRKKKGIKGKRILLGPRKKEDWKIPFLQLMGFVFIACSICWDVVTALWITVTRSGPFGTSFNNPWHSTMFSPILSLSSTVMSFNISSKSEVIFIMKLSELLVFFFNLDWTGFLGDFNPFLARVGLGLISTVELNNLARRGFKREQRSIEREGSCDFHPLSAGNQRTNVWPWVDWKDAKDRASCSYWRDSGGWVTF